MYEFIGFTFVPSKHNLLSIFYTFRSAMDSETNKEVAIKKVPRAFDDPVDAKRILREIKLMKKFKHENVGAFRKCICFDLVHVCMKRLSKSWILFRPPLAQRNLRISILCRYDTVHRL